jgi:hypothetical protein
MKALSPSVLDKRSKGIHMAALQTGIPGSLQAAPGPGICKILLLPA